MDSLSGSKISIFPYGTLASSELGSNASGWIPRPSLSCAAGSATKSPGSPRTTGAPSSSPHLAPARSATPGHQQVAAVAVWSTSDLPPTAAQPPVAPPPATPKPTLHTASLLGLTALVGGGLLPGNHVASEATLRSKRTWSRGPR
eukprot:2737645-Prymnesium_polylepis.1